MPRDGSNIYHRPAGTDAVTDTTIESSKYNALVADLEQDANLPRPIVAGGTGATSALAAMIALSGEVAKQGPVTNYDSYPWVNGSFFSSAGATSAPTGSSFTGLYYEYSGGQYATIEAREITGTSASPKYVRTKNAGVWGAWVVDPSTADVATKVSKAGDTMSGDLTMSKASPTLTINKTLSSSNIGLSGTFNGAGRWFISPGNANPESGSNTGSDFAIYRYTDAGAFIGEALSIKRSSGDVAIAGQLNVSSSVVTSGAGFSVGTFYFGNSGTRYLTYDGTQFILNGGQLIVNSNITTTGRIYVQSGGINVNGWGGSNTTGVIFFNTAETHFIYKDVTRWQFVGGLPVLVGEPVAGTDAATKNYADTKQANLGFTPVQQGGGTFQQTNKVYIGFDGARLRCTIDATDFGRFIMESQGVVGGRLLFLGDLSVAQTNADPNPGAVVVSIFSSGQQRLRWNQLLIGGAYVTVGTA